ncbi:NAD-dependent epimerase/dehydratase family protein [Geodermatophilus sp. CPCC 205761]|uniref:NAD-dependent epimerase/dehydratase family protein n=1 Tax=Geodermatophilus sp. CPCC 205761 TaxID=2936597 RepID=UPI003EE96296
MGPDRARMVGNTVQELFATDDVLPGIDLFGMPVVVTGGTGFLGAYVVPRLVAAGCRVSVVGPDAGWREPLRQSIHEGVVRLIAEPDWWRPASARRVARAAAGAEQWVHLAYTPVPPGRGTPTGRARHEVTVNLAGAMELLSALGDRLGHVLVRSTVEVYGRAPACPVDEDVRPMPDDCGAAAKLALEDQLRIVATTGGPEVTVLRLTTVYGPGETSLGAVPSFIRAALAGAPATIAGDGLEQRDYLHVADAARLVARAVARPPLVSSSSARFRLVNAGSGTAERTVALAHRVRRVVAEQKGQVPPPPQHIEGRAVSDLVCRTERVRREFGFRPVIGLDEGLAEEIAWFLRHSEWWSQLEGDTDPESLTAGAVAAGRGDVGRRRDVR